MRILVAYSRHPHTALITFYHVCTIAPKSKFSYSFVYSVRAVWETAQTNQLQTKGTVSIDQVILSVRKFGTPIRCSSKTFTLIFA